MTMCEPSPPQGSLPMELPLTSSPAASRAKTFPLLESSAAWVKEPVPVSGPKSSDLLASYDRNTSSWRTSQHCFLAQANGEADGLAEFSETWPSAGMMRNGRTFRRRPWALPIAASASGLWPTPNTEGYRSDGEIAMLTKRLTDYGEFRAMTHKAAASKRNRFWPTPTATMHKGSSPAALTRKDGQDRSRDRLDHFIQSTEGDGKLNPTWVEWLMGFPTGHTDLKA